MNGANFHPAQGTSADVYFPAASTSSPTPLDMPIQTALYPQPIFGSVGGATSFPQGAKPCFSSLWWRGNGRGQICAVGRVFTVGLWAAAREIGQRHGGGAAAAWSTTVYFGFLGRGAWTRVGAEERANQKANALSTSPVRPWPATTGGRGQRGGRLALRRAEKKPFFATSRKAKSTR